MIPPPRLIVIEGRRPFDLRDPASIRVQLNRVIPTQSMQISVALWRDRLGLSQATALAMTEANKPGHIVFVTSDGRRHQLDEAGLYSATRFYYRPFADGFVYRESTVNALLRRELLEHRPGPLHILVPTAFALRLARQFERAVR
ncbi:MAG: hypothetical protein GC182_03045 [Rhodopseudomonas sp.]|nr:hypothetical protein [Rhodopseudomonas sp.]